MCVLLLDQQEEEKEEEKEGKTEREKTTRRAKQCSDRLSREKQNVSSNDRMYSSPPPHPSANLFLGGGRGFAFANTCVQYELPNHPFSFQPVLECPFFKCMQHVSWL